MEVEEGELRGVQERRRGRVRWQVEYEGRIWNFGECP